MRKGRRASVSHLSILSLGLFCCYILMAVVLFLSLSHCISGTMHMGKKKKGKWSLSI